MQSYSLLVTSRFLFFYYFMPGQISPNLRYLVFIYSNEETADVGDDNRG